MFQILSPALEGFLSKRSVPQPSLLFSEIFARFPGVANLKLRDWLE